MRLPSVAPVQFTVAPRPEHGVAEATRVLACGVFDHADRTDPTTYSGALYALMTGDRALAPEFGHLLQTTLRRGIDPSRYDFLTLVPAHDGEGQSEIRAVATGLPVPADQVVTRTRGVTPNKSIDDPDDRWRNVAGSIDTTRSVTGERVIVIDDVLSSGASMAVTAAALRRAGAATVVGAVLGVRPSGARDQRRFEPLGDPANELSPSSGYPEPNTRVDRGP